MSRQGTYNASEYISQYKHSEHYIVPTGLYLMEIHALWFWWFILWNNDIDIAVLNQQSVQKSISVSIYFCAIFTLFSRTYVYPVIRIERVNNICALSYFKKKKGEIVCLSNWANYVNFCHSYTNINTVHRYTLLKWR